jgi:hypothetical protein
MIFILLKAVDEDIVQVLQGPGRFRAPSRDRPELATGDGMID